MLLEMPLASAPALVNQQAVHPLALKIRPILWQDPVSVIVKVRGKVTSWDKLEEVIP